MRFVPRKARDDVNVSDEHPLIEAGYLVIAVSAVFAVLMLVAVFAVDIALLFFSPEDEAEFFGHWAPADIDTVVEEDLRTADTDDLLHRLASHWPESPYQYRVQVSVDDEPNAMAFPGGLVVVTSALLDQVESQNELAFVLGHELGHYHNRDHIRMLGRMTVVGILLAAVSGGDAANLSVNIAELGFLSFSREQETDADAFGLALVQAEYGHVAESWRFFERLEALDPDRSGFVSYFSTHPAHAHRVDDLRSLARSRGWAMNGGLTELGWEHAE